MRISQIRDFVAVIQAGSLRAAARHVGVSQPAITKSIRQLESELQVQLLQRNARGAVATAAGKAFLTRARAVQGELRKAAEDLEPFRGGAEGSVAMGVSPQVAMLVIPEAMQEFRRRHPKARVRIVEGVNTAFLPLLRDQTMDFSMGMSPAQPLGPGLRFKPLLRLPLVVGGRKNHPLGSAASLRELADASWLMFYPLGVGAMLEKAFTQAGLPMPRAIVQCESYATALALLAGTETLGLVTPRILGAPLGPYGIEQIRIRETLPAPLLGIYLRDTPLTSAAAAMAQAVTASARRLARLD